MEAPNNNERLYSAAADLHLLVNDNTLHNKAAVATKTLVNLFVYVYNFDTAGTSIISLAKPGRFFPFFFVVAEKRVW